MRRWIWVALMALLAAPFATAVRAASLESYGRLPSLENVAMSPDGTLVAFVKTEGDERAIEFYSLTDHKMVSAVRVGDQKLRAIGWADDVHLMVITSEASVPLGLDTGLREWGHLQVYDVKAHRLRAIPAQSYDNNMMMNVIFGVPMVRYVQGHTMLFVQVAVISSSGQRSLERVDLTGGSESTLQVGDFYTRQLLVDAAGDLVAEGEYDDAAGHWWLKVRKDGRLQEVANGTQRIDVPDILGFGPEPDTILLQNMEEGESVWRLVSLKDGSFSAAMAEHRSLEAPIETSNPPRMIGGIDGEGHYVFFDPGMQLRWDKIASTFAGDRLTLASHDNDLLRMVVLVDSPTHGYVYDLVDLQQNKILQIGEVYAGGIKPLETREINYAAADGLKIPAYLTLPRGRAPQKLPLIVLPHGGPEARDSADFDWWSQALADQGYAVLRPNYRGSLVSQKFVRAGYGQWGRKMQTDLSDGVRYLAKEGIIDPARVCIVGASYGGYAALAGVTLDPGVYRCAVAVAGLSDLSLQLAWVEHRNQYTASREQRYWNQFMGASGPRDPALGAISPIKHLDAITAPVLLIHGKDDTVVPYEQSQVMFDAMRRANKDVEFVTLKHEDHWLSRSETRLQMLQTSVAFLRKHNPPD